MHTVLTKTEILSSARQEDAYLTQLSGTEEGAFDCEACDTRTAVFRHVATGECLCIPCSHPDRACGECLDHIAPPMGDEADTAIISRGQIFCDHTCSDVHFDRELELGGLGYVEEGEDALEWHRRHTGSLRDEEAVLLRLVYA